MIEENTGQRDQSFSPHRIYAVANGLLGACDIPPSQAIELAEMIVDLFRRMEILELQRIQHEEAD